MTMKHNFYLILFAASVLTGSAFAQQISLNGIIHNIDTLAAYPVGPGSDYLRLRMSRTNSNAYDIDVFVLRVDTKNPYVSLHQELGQNKVVGTERPSAMATRISTPTHVAFAGTNGDFFATSGDIGRPTGLTVEDNEFAYVGSTNRRVGGVTAEGKPIVATNWKYSGKLYTAGNKDTLTIKHVNYSRNTDELVLYNQLQGTTTGTNQFGTEMLVELCPGESWKTNGKHRVIVRSREQNKGKMAIPAGQAVLSGHGAMQKALDSLVNIGDTLTIRFSLKLDDVTTSLSQAIGGDNYALILDNGVAEKENFWNEIHPRTGYGVSQLGDTAVFCVVDGRTAQSYGCTTSVLGEIMRYYGAWRAVNWDGGGSSSMYIRQFGNQVNHGSDGSERAVGNAMFAIANMPEEDNTIAALYPYYPVYSLPYCGLYTPHFLGYNKYGLLLDTDVQGVQLSCDPSVGEIQNDGSSFFASTRNGGKLTATLGEATVDIEIRIVPGNMHVRYKKVVMDTRKDWQVEVVNSNVDGEQIVSAPALNWKSLNPDICTVNDDGFISAVSNGYAQIVGFMEDFSDTMLVSVEIPQASPLLIEDFTDPDSWRITSMTGFYPQWKEVDGAPAVGFTFAITRKPYVLLEKSIPFYGLPDTMKINYGTDAMIDNLKLSFATASGQSAVKSLYTVPTSPDAQLELPISDLLSNKDSKAHYPLSLSQMQFYLTTSTQAGERYIKLKSITLCYEGFEFTSLTDIHNSNLVVYPNPAKDMVCVQGAAKGSLYRLFDVEGRSIQEGRVDDGVISFPMIQSGIYFLHIDGETVRIIKH